MIAVKEAVLAKEKGGSQVETTIFYMDMRASGLPYQRFCDNARREHQVRFERARVHSVTAEPVSGDPVLRITALDGSVANEVFDLVVLAAGQRPAAGSDRLAEMAGMNLNPWGFIATSPPYPTRTDNAGILAAGSCAGLKDISAAMRSVGEAAVVNPTLADVRHALGGASP